MTVASHSPFTLPMSHFTREPGSSPSWRATCTGTVVRSDRLFDTAGAIAVSAESSLAMRDGADPCRRAPGTARRWCTLPSGAGQVGLPVCASASFRTVRLSGGAAQGADFARTRRRPQATAGGVERCPARARARPDLPEAARSPVPKPQTRQASRSRGRAPLPTCRRRR